jgi:hypothetical protein
MSEIIHGGTEKTMEKLIRYSRPPDRDLNPKPPKTKHPAHNPHFQKMKLRKTGNSLAVNRSKPAASQYTRIRLAQLQAALAALRPRAAHRNHLVGT